MLSNSSIAILASYIYCLKELSHQEKPEEENPKQDFPEPDNPSTETKDTYNTIINKKENNNILMRSEALHLTLHSSITRRTKFRKKNLTSYMVL